MRAHSRNLSPRLVNQTCEDTFIKRRGAFPCHESFFEVGNRFKTKLAVTQSRVEKGRFVVNGRVFVTRSDSERNLAA